MLFFWIFLYGLLYTLAEAVTPLAGNSPWLTPLTMLGYLLILLFRLAYTKQLNVMGLSFVQLQTKTDIVYLLPLLILPALNIYSSASRPPSPYVLLMFSVCFAEELLFRGYLLSGLVHYLGKWGIVCTALLFSLLHSVNLFSAMEPSYVLAQMLLAFFVGIYFSLICIYFKSLYPCIAAHFLTNITAQSDGFPTCYYLILIAVLSSFGFFLYFKISSALEDTT